MPFKNQLLNNLVANLQLIQPLEEQNMQAGNNGSSLSLREPIVLKNIKNFTAYGVPFKEAVLLNLLPNELKKNCLLTAVDVYVMPSFSADENFTINYTITTINPVDLSSSFSLLPQLNNVVLNITLNNQGNNFDMQASLSATAEFIDNNNKLIFEVNIDLLTKTAEAQLAQPGQLAPLLQKFGINEFGPEMILSACNLFINSSTKSYSIGFDIIDSKVYTEYIVDRQVNLTVEEIQFYIQHNPQNHVRKIFGKSSFSYKDKFEIEVEMMRTSGTSNNVSLNETIVSGVFDPGKIFKLKDLIDVSSFPTELQEVGIENIGLSYSSRQGLSLNGTIADLVTFDGNDFSLSFSMGPGIKSLTGTWNNDGKKKFDGSSYALGGLAKWIDPVSASITIAMSTGQNLFEIDFQTYIILDDQADVQPLLNLSVSRVGGSDVSNAQKTVTASLVFGEISFNLDLSKSVSDTTINAALNTSGGNTKLNHFVGQVGPYFGQKQVPSFVPNMSFNAMTLVYDKSQKSLQFDVATGSLNFRMGPNNYYVNLKVQILSVYNNELKKRTTTGSMIGVFSLGQMTFDIEMTLGASTLFTAYWKTDVSGGITLTEFANQLGLPSWHIAMPSEFQFKLVQMSLQVDLKNDTVAFTALTENKQEVFFVAGKQNGTWGFYAGLYLTQKTTLDKLPKVGKYLGAFGDISVGDVLLLVSTITATNVNLATLGLPALKDNTGQMGVGGPNITRSKPPGFRGGTLSQVGYNYLNLYPGAMLGFELSLNSKPSSPLGRFGSVAKKDKLFFICEFADPISKSYLEASLGMSFTLNFGSKKMILNNPVVKINLQMAVSLIGQFNMPMGSGSSILVEPIFSISEESMDFAINIDADSNNNFKGLPFGLKGLLLDKIGLEFGLEFDTMAPELGFTGDFHIINQSADSDDFGIVVSLDGEIPNIDYFSCYISQLSIREFLVAYTGNPNPSYPAAFDIVQANDISLFWCDNPVVLPDSTSVMPGFGFNGNLQIFNFFANANLLLDSSGAFSGSAEFSPIDWGMLTLKGDGGGVSIKQNLVNGNWIPAQPPKPGDKNTYPTRMQSVVPAGGAIASFSDQGPNYLNIDFDFTLFKFIETSLQIELSKQGFLFDFSYHTGDIFKADLNCTITGDGFSAGADAAIKLDFTIPPFHLLLIPIPEIKLDAGLSANFNIAISKTSFSLDIGGSFEFDGHSLQLPSLSITVEFSSVADLVKKIAQQIIDNVAKIFKQVFDELTGFLNKGFQDVKKFADHVGQDIAHLGGEIDDFGKSVLNNLSRFSEHAWSDIENGAKDFGENLLHGLENFGEDLGNDLKKGFDEFGNDIKSFFGNVGSWVEDHFEHAEYEREQNHIRQVKADLAVYQIMQYTANTKSIIQESDTQLSQLMGNITVSNKQSLSDLLKIKSEFESAQVNTDAQIYLMAQMIQKREQAMKISMLGNGKMALERASLNFTLAIEMCLLNLYGSGTASDSLKDYLNANFDFVYNQISQVFSTNNGSQINANIDDVLNGLDAIYNGYLNSYYSALQLVS